MVENPGAILNEDNSVLTALFSCETCEELFSTQTFLEVHQQQEHPKGPSGKYCCTYCPYSSNIKARVDVHLRTHTGEQPFVCSVCKKGFKQSSGLRNHWPVHTGEKSYKCAKCGLCFGTASNMTRHLRKVHFGEGRASYKCPHCKKGFSQQSNLKRHLRTHSGARPHVCSLCSMRFDKEGHLIRHKNKVHSHQYSLKCPQCGKSFCKLFNLRRHLRLVHRKTHHGTQMSDRGAFQQQGDASVAGPTCTDEK